MSIVGILGIAAAVWAVVTYGWLVGIAVFLLAQIVSGAIYYAVLRVQERQLWERQEADLAQVVGSIHGLRSSMFVEDDVILVE